MGQISTGSPSRRDTMLRYTAVIVLFLSLGANAQRRGGRAQSFRQGRDAPALPLTNEFASYGGAASDVANDPLAALSSSVPGVPGEDYPIFSEVPETAFACDGQVDGGYYADPEAECQVFHICTADGAGGLAKYSFLCPNGTLFNQNYFVCDWWFNFDCSTAEELYSLNDEIAAERESIDASASADAPVSTYGAAEDTPVYEGGAERRGRRIGGQSNRRGNF